MQPCSLTSHGRSAAWPAVVLCLLAGCESSAPDAVVAVEIAAEGDNSAAALPLAATLVSVAGDAPEADGAVNAADESDAPTPAPAETEEAAMLSAYKPPFPDRVDLFTAPKRQGGVPADAAGEGDAIALLGFVHVDRPQAVLSINGQVTPIAEGDVEQGVEVISIQPPMVVLQRGRQRWQASLEN